MHTRRRFTLTQYLIEQRRRFPSASGDFNALLLDVALACKAISRSVAFGKLSGMPGAELTEVSTSVNVQGEEQKRLDVISNLYFTEMTEWGGHLAGMASEEMDEPYQIPATMQRGKYMLVFDPLDGSSNIDVNVTVGSIFSVLRAPQAVIDSGRDVVEADFLQPGTQQLAAGYALYGPTTMLVLRVIDGSLAAEESSPHPARDTAAMARTASPVVALCRRRGGGVEPSGALERGNRDSPRG